MKIWDRVLLLGMIHEFVFVLEDIQQHIEMIFDILMMDCTSAHEMYDAVVMSVDFHVL